MNGHPSFANPQIREALCEVHFVLPKDTGWEPAIFGRFYRHIQDDFPEMEPVAETAMRLQLQPGKVEFMQGQNRMRYKHKSRNLFLQLAAGVLTVNVLDEYPGWQVMKEDIHRAWAWAEEVVRPIGINRIGLRYINFVPRTEPAERPIDWFSPNDYVARMAMDSLPGVLSRVEVHTDINRRSIVTMSEANDEDRSYFVLDIDCIAERLSETLPIDATIEQLHDSAWNIFASFIGPRLRRVLEGDGA